MRQPAERSSGDSAATTWSESAEKSVADEQDFEKNVVKTFSVFKPKSTIYTPTCGTWVKTFAELYKGSFIGDILFHLQADKSPE